MRLGLNFGYWGSVPVDNVALAQEADRLGFHSLWTAEAYGSDAVSPLVWLAAQTKQINVGTAIMQMTARVPAMAAMTAATIDLLTGGRMLCGIGASGPQVVEGWHGVPYGKPVTRAREYIEIMRAIWKREAPLVHHGEHYDIPCQGGSGLGKPLKLIQHPLRPSIPIYLAAVGPKNVALAAELADGWLPIFFSPERVDGYREWLDDGFAKAGNGKSMTNGFDIAPTVHIVLGDDVNACRNQVKPTLALYIGGMGAKGKNFYYDIACRYGYEAAAEQIQGFYLTGKKMEALAAVPDALVDEVALCGPRARIAERLAAWKHCGITTMICGTSDLNAVRMMAELVL
ncbi:MAG: LLM class F420-dependent oxidoreductase [Acidobacteria bacterium]|nr:LLM class F420-dependent oxidoreductase [Acidobacteriota bacterium]MBI3422279.1 LLM class F420-dependent oxidoreductase [Acidobacteriota bacterium]